MLKRQLLAFCICFAFTAAQSQVVIYTDAGNADSVRAASEILQTELSKAGIGSFKSESLSSFKGTGIVLAQFNQLSRAKINLPAIKKLKSQEALVIRANGQSVIIAGATALAIQQGVYMYLEQLGFRYFLPGDLWTIIPVLSSPYKKYEIATQPAYDYRWIANGHGYYNSKKIADEFTRWAKANRLGGSFDIKVGHSYDEIVQRNMEAFKQHPEYFGQPPAKGTIPVEFKFDVTNKNLVDLVVKDALGRYELQQRIKDFAPMVSMEPSDGGGFCNTPACKEIGTQSDQAFYLTNIVAKEFQKKYPGVWVGSYAYNEHILPTKYKLEPNVFVMITNGFNRSKYSTEELMQLWGKKASRIGVYDYLGVYEWDNDLPGQVAVAKIKYITKNVKKFYNSGARSFQGESYMGWINKGPAQYILARLLWNINVNTDSIRNDFFTRAFEKATVPVKKLYDNWENYPHRVPYDNDLANWLQWTNEAYQLANNAKVKQRIDQIKIYLHYVYLFRNLKKTPSEENMIGIMNYAYRNFENPAFATLPTMVSLPYYSGYKGWGLYDNPVQKWKNNNQPYTQAEIDQNFQIALKGVKKTEGIATFVKANSFVKLSGIISLPKQNFYEADHAMWDKTEYIIRIEKQSDQNWFELKSDFSAQPPVARPVEVKIYPLKQDAISEPDEKPVLLFEQFEKIKIERFSLAALKPGTYRLLINDHRKMFIINFAPPVDYSVIMDAEFKLNTTSATGLNVFYLYVPPGVKKFQVTKTKVLRFKTPAGRIIDKQNNLEETFIVDVAPGEDGLWIIEQQAGALYMEGVPPYLGDHPSRMLVPANLKK